MVDMRILILHHVDLVLNMAICAARTLRYFLLCERHDYMLIFASLAFFIVVMRRNKTPRMERTKKLRCLLFRQNCQQKP